MNFSCDGWTEYVAAHTGYLVVGSGSVLSVRGGSGTGKFFSFRSILPEIGPTFMVRPAAALLEQFSFRLEQLHNIAITVGTETVRTVVQTVRRCHRMVVRVFSRIIPAVRILRL
ncbi:MAG: hypothetical protein IJC73_06615 [Lentisphaeria bacterium]|nr:hypothetical protein [Lentisphaeria bacterium]